MRYNINDNTILMIHNINTILMIYNINDSQSDHNQAFNNHYQSFISLSLSLSERTFSEAHSQMSTDGLL
jgi:hypothetical protein